MIWEAVVGAILVPAGMYSLAVVAAGNGGSIQGVVASMMMTAGILEC